MRINIGLGRIFGRGRPAPIVITTVPALAPVVVVDPKAALLAALDAKRVYRTQVANQLAAIDAEITALVVKISVL